ncbi:MAG: helix-turn-helix transcriptional regulator [Planctomycetaceae bacterium]|nr:helix-turn-helix transcriptional regulator [Planctomycetaceae bacterium]
MTFGQRVRELREKRGLTQRELADALAVSVSYISKVENEKLHFGD